MARVADHMLDCVAYLYPTLNAAKQNEQVGGTAFIVDLPATRIQDVRIPYFVTARHCVRRQDSGPTVVRLNAHDKRLAGIETTQSDWFCHPDGDDIAICPANISPELKYFAVPIDSLLTREIAAAYDIGPGDDVFMVGRFVHHDGRQQNLPAMRFGSIAMKPIEPIRDQRNLLLESYLIEMRSLAGYSGSPVFVSARRFAAGPEWNASSPEEFVAAQVSGQYEDTWLLGLDYGHLPIRELVRERDGTPIGDQWHIRVNSGAATIAPAWKIIELLYEDDVVAHRDEAEQRWLAEQNPGVDPG